MRRIVGAVLPGVATAGVGSTPALAVAGAETTCPFVVKLTPATRYASPDAGVRRPNGVPAAPRGVEGSVGAVTATDFTVSARMHRGTAAALDCADGRVRRSALLDGAGQVHPPTTLLRLRAVG